MLHALIGSFLPREAGKKDQDAYGASDVLELREIPRPSPGTGEVLIRVAAAGVDQGVWHLMAGLPYLIRLFGFGLTKPKVAVRGREVAGVVEAVGAGVTRFQPGTEVFGTCDGSFAGYALAKADKLAKKPSNLSFEESAAAPISGVTALQAVRDAGAVAAGQRVLVIGAGGGVGCFAVQVAKAFGAEVTGVCSTGKMELVRSLGADRVLDYTREDFSRVGVQYDASSIPPGTGRSLCCGGVSETQGARLDGEPPGPGGSGIPDRGRQDKARGRQGVCPGRCACGHHVHA